MYTLHGDCQGAAAWVSRHWGITSLNLGPPEDVPLSQGPKVRPILFRLKSFWNARAFTQSRAQVLQGQLGQNDEVHQVLKAFVVLGGR
jgi:hypothetical protein